MAHESARGDRASRFHSSGSERGRAAPAADYAASGDEDDFDDLDDLKHLRHKRVSAEDDDRDGWSSLADELIDGLVPPEIDWRIIVRRHPLPALLLAGIGGYLLGRSQGQTLVRAFSALAVARVESEVLSRIEDDLG